MKKGLKRGLFLFLLITIYTISLVSSQEFDYLLSNSEDWKDVYSTVHYGNLIGLQSSFLVSTKHGNLILGEIPKKSKIRVFTSRKNPYVFNYQELLKANDFQGSEEIVTDNVNLRLGEEVNVDSYVIIGDSYGFSAIAVAPYAVQTKSWVFFANKNNINQIDNILEDKNPRKIIIYGYVDKEVRDILNKYNPEIIDNKDRFKDNIEIVKKYLELKQINQVVLSNGEFIEKEIMSGAEPVLFTGKDNVPDQIRDYIKNSDIEIGVLIGNDLVGAATNIRRSTGISVMVKFARGSRGQAGGVAAVEGLDIFPLPTPIIKLNLYSVKYNRLKSELLVTYKSDSNVPLFLKGTITLIDGDERSKVGDLENVFVAPGEYKTVIYSINAKNINELEAEIFTLFGESPSSLDRIIQARVKVETLDIIDKCIINKENIKSVMYNKQKKAFVIKIKNPNDIDCWVALELNDVYTGYTQTTLSAKGSILIPAGKTKNIEIPQELTNDDIEKNSIIDISLYSGEKEDTVIFRFREKFALKISSLSILTIIAIILAVLIVILIIIIFFIKKREEEEED